uniref:Uncharacterized protein n=1 Tax=Caenorhabditis tropicalis TaxID=1561998 RepID=A0A1I7TFX0_9PELO
MKDLEESDYDSVRPTLITLTAKQLKSFMDRNPQMERIADGLFRRHCQIDCPEIVPKKIKMETWRTMHDVFMNWKICVYTEIIAGDELSNGTILVESSLNETIIESGIPTEIPYEQFVVFCREPSGNHFYNKTFFNFIQKSEKNPSSETIGKTNGLMIFSISGMSHNQAFRHMKQTLKLAAKNDFQSFSMFNQESNNNWNNSMKSFGNNQKIWDSARDNSGSVSFLHTDSSEFSKLFGNQFDYHPNLYNYFNQQYLGHVDNCISDGSVRIF